MTERNPYDQMEVRMDGRTPCGCEGNRGNKDLAFLLFTLAFSL